jgi:hypothetical protein
VCVCVCVCLFVFLLFVYFFVLFSNIFGFIRKPKYLENFVQACFDALPQNELKGKKIKKKQKKEETHVLAAKLNKGRQ